jgi:T-complex protein 1 subunit alpha
VLATQAIANVVKSSFGPSGLDKMMVDDIGDVTVTNDGATILSLLDIEHPAGKILVDLAQQQDKEVGDGTTSVVIIAAELLRRANELMKNKIHRLQAGLEGGGQVHEREHQHKSRCARS